MNKIIKTTLLVAVMIFLIAILTGVLNVNKQGDPDANRYDFGANNIDNDCDDPDGEGLCEALDDDDDGDSIPTENDESAANLECGQGTILEGGACIPDGIAADPLAGTSWTWEETFYNNDDVIVPVDSSDFVARFSEDGTFSSTTDCNNTFGSYTLGDDTSLTFGPMAATMMACMEETKEMAYGGMLSEVSSYMIDDSGKLVLMLKYDSGSMIFVPHTVVEADVVTGVIEEGKATDYNSSRSY